MKKMMFYPVFIQVVLFLFAFIGHTEMASDNYRISTSVMSGGGEPMASMNFQTDSTLGQSSPLMDPSAPPLSSNYNLEPGFWYAVQTVNTCKGDVELDGDVDGMDLSVFVADFGRTDCNIGDPCEGDFDGNNSVDDSDLETFATDFGRMDCP